MSSEGAPKKQHKLLIEFVFRFPQKSLWRLWSRKFPVQGEPFEYGLRIKNIDTLAFSGGKISQIKIDNPSAGFSQDASDAEFLIPSLNPNRSSTIWVQAVELHFQGTSWVNCSIVSSDPNIDVYTYQLEYGNNPVAHARNLNHWGNSLVIQGLLEVQQARTNSYVLLLTALTFIEGVWSLKNVANGIMDLTGRALIASGNYLQTLLIK